MTSYLSQLVYLILCFAVLVAQAEVRPISFQCYNVDMYKKRSDTSDTWLSIIGGVLSAISSLFGSSEENIDTKLPGIRPYFSNVIDGSECVPYIGKGEKVLDSSDAILNAATMAPLNSFSKVRRDVTRVHFFSGSDDAIEAIKVDKDQSPQIKKSEVNSTVKKKNTVLLILPGGSYARISNHESISFPFEVLERAKESIKSKENNISFLPVVIQYRLPPLSPYSPSEDISFAVRLLARYRSHAKVNFMKNPMFEHLINEDISSGVNSTTVLNPASLGLEENFSIVIIGFSAGGHAAATYVAKSSLIPIQAVILAYPVISMDDPNIYHVNTTKNLLGVDIKSIFPRTDSNEALTTNPDAKEQNSTEAVDNNDSESLYKTIALAGNFSINNFPSNFPRCVYITHALDDPRVPVKHSQNMYNALVKYRKKNSIFLKGGKGKGIGIFRLLMGSIFDEQKNKSDIFFEEKYDVAIRIHPSGPHGQWSLQKDKPMLSNWWADVEKWLATKRSEGKCIY